MYKRSTSIADLQDRNGRQPPYHCFNRQGQTTKEAYVITTFGIFLLAMRQRNPRKEWLESSAYQSIKKIVNTVCLEQFSEDDSGATITNHEPASPKRIRMERHIRLLREKNEQQETVILPARAYTCLNNIENVFESNFAPNFNPALVNKRSDTVK